MHKLTCSLIALTCSLSLPAAVPLRWTVETSRVQPADFDAFHGEELALEAVLTSYGRPVNLDGKSARIYWQTNGMGSAYWSAPATAVSNRLAATFGPEMDPGGATVRGFIGMAGENYRAAFLLRLRGSPGPIPGYLPLPVPILDFDRVQVENAPYLTRSETENALAAATNAMPRGAAKRGFLREPTFSSSIGLPHVWL